MSSEPDNPQSAAAARPEDFPSRRWWFWLVGLSLGYFSVLVYKPSLFFILGVVHYDGWFIDTFALLASNDAVTRGLNPYVPNPLDYFGRLHVYSHWWLHLRDLGLTRADARWLGLSLVGSFLIAAWWRLRLSSPRQLFCYLAVMCCSPIVLAMERGNNDLVVFLLLTPLVPLLQSERRWLRWTAPFLVTVAILLKYYPATAGLLLLVGADRKEVRLRLLVAILLFVLAALNVRGDLAIFGPLAPQPAGLLSFGAMGAFNEYGWSGWVPKLICTGVGLATVVLAWTRRWLEDWTPAPALRTEGLYFILGAVLLTGCFFTSMNFGYRWIFAIWLAPFLWLLPRASATPVAVRCLARLVLGLLLVVLWWDAAACLLVNGLIGRVTGTTIMLLARWSFLLEQPLYWAFFLCLLVFLTQFTRVQLGRLFRVS